jgi:hypothetical protein
MKADAGSFRGHRAFRLANRRLISTPAIMLPILAGLMATPGLSQRGGRSRPPESAACPRDRLTAYSGKPAAYERTLEWVQVSIHTDWDTVESVRITLSPDEDVRSHFLLRGEPYGQRNLGEIEEAQGKLKTGMGVTAWVCESGPQPLLDWRPPEKD